MIAGTDARTTARASTLGIGQRSAVALWRVAAPSAAPMPPTMNAPIAARTAEVWMSPALDTADTMPARTPDAPAVAAAKAGSSTGSTTTQCAVAATIAMLSRVAPRGTRPSETSPASNPDPSETNHVRADDRANPESDKSADPRAAKTNSPETASDPTAERIAVRKAGRRKDGVDGSGTTSSCL